MVLARMLRLPDRAGMTRSAAAVLGLAVLLGAAAGTVAAMLGGGDGGAPPQAGATVTEPPPTTVLESGFWTAIIASVQSSRPNARAEADRAAAAARRDGQDAFVLDGSAYEGLNDGYLAVCVGRFEHQEEARTLQEELAQLGYRPYRKNVGKRTGAGDGAGGDAGDGGGG